jgi:D-xylose transport system substrate-binding protein
LGIVGHCRYDWLVFHNHGYEVKLRDKAVRQMRNKGDKHMHKLTTMPSMLAGILAGLALLAAGCSPIVPPTVPPTAGADAGNTATPAAIEAAPATGVGQDTTGTAAPGVCTPGEGSIAVLLPDSVSSPRWEMDDRRYFDGTLAAAGVNYTISNAQGDPAIQRQQAQQALVEGAKVLILVNLDSESGAGIIADARAAGAHVIDYDRLTIAGPGADIYISFDNLKVGAEMAQTLEPAINALGKEQPRIVQLNGAPTDNNATLVRAGYSSVATPYYDQGKWQLLADKPVPDWDPQQADELFRQILAGAGEEGVDAVFAANDALAGAVVQVLKTQGLPPVVLSGQDATVEGLQNILAGWQTMTVYKSIQQEAATAVIAALTFLNCEGVDTLITTTAINNGERDIPSILLDPVAVTKDNIDSTVIADRFRSWDEICVNEYAQYCPPEEQQ